MADQLPPNTATLPGVIKQLNYGFWLAWVVSAGVALLFFVLGKASGGNISNQGALAGLIGFYLIVELLIGVRGTFKSKLVLWGFRFGALLTFMIWVGFLLLN